MDPGIPQSQKSHKLVLYIQGYPASGQPRATCDSLVHSCGGDSERTFNLERPSLFPTLLHARKVRAFSDSQRPALCIMHKTRQLAEMLTARRAFEGCIPIGRTAPWMLYWDHIGDPDFLIRAQHQGVLIGDIGDGATWRHESGLEFLILCGLITSPAQLATEAQWIAQRRQQRQRGPVGPASPPPHMPRSCPQGASIEPYQG